MTKKKSEKEILEAAQAEGKLWLEAFNPSAKQNVKAVQEELEKLYPECLVRVVASPKEAAVALEEGVAECLETQDKKVIRDKIRELQPWNCIWDYYLMAFYECACGQLEDEPEFTRRSLFPAFKAGLGFLINLGAPPVNGEGGLLIGVCRPEAYLDDDRRIHREDGPAIIQGEEEEYWFHGVQVEKDWIMKRSELQPSLFLKETNAEKKRVLAELIGWELIAATLGFKIIQEDKWGQLLRVEDPLDDEDVKHSLFVRVTCPSTGRVYVHRVDPKTKTAHEGVASMWQVKPDEFFPQQES